MKRFLNFLASGMLFAGATFQAAAITEPVTVGNARFTFITDNLVRMEYAVDGKFLNDSTLFAIVRSPREVDVKIERDGRKYLFSTPVMTIVYDADGCPFGQNNIHAKWNQNGKEEKWYIWMRQSKNLLGPVVTLDEVTGPVERMEGLLSRDGWYVINDTGKDIYKNGKLEHRDGTHMQDLYLFVYGDDYKKALKSLAAISGPIPMTRKYIHGSWYCRWWPYTADDYRDIVDGYHEHDFPMDVLVFDMDWHRKKDATIGMGHAGTRGWTGYSWNRELIPDPEKLIGELHDKNIFVALNDHPHDGIRPHEDEYKAFIEELGFDTIKHGVPISQPNNPKYMKAFFNHAHRTHEKIGASLWWLDWQQDYALPYISGTSTRHLPWLNELYYNDTKHSNQRGAAFSRWGGWGDHRHPIQFSGDDEGNWEMLKFLVDLTTSSGNAGCFFWAHDTGGFYGGRDPELYTRWTQYALLNSSLRVHSVVDKKLDRRPWLWGEREEKVMRDVYHLRSKLMPYVYTSVRQCHSDMLPLLRGLYIENPTDSMSYTRPDEFLFGDLILGAPVTEPGSGKDFIVNKEVYFPAGSSWYHLFNGKRFEGGSIATVPTPLEESPIFVKGGWMLPMQPYTERMASTPLTTLVVRCYPGADGDNHTYQLYEDDGLTLNYEKGRFATTDLNYSRKGNRQTYVINPVKGEYDGQPLKRAYRFELPGIDANSKVKALGCKAKTSYDKASDMLIVEIPATNIRRKIEISVN